MLNPDLLSPTLTRVSTLWETNHLLVNFALIWWKFVLWRCLYVCTPKQYSHPYGIQTLIPYTHSAPRVTVVVLVSVCLPVCRQAESSPKCQISSIPGFIGLEWYAWKSYHIKFCRISFVQKKKLGNAWYRCAIAEHWGIPFPLWLPVVVNSRQAICVHVRLCNATWLHVHAACIISVLKSQKKVDRGSVCMLSKVQVALKEDSRLSRYFHHKMPVL